MSETFKCVLARGDDTDLAVEVLFDYLPASRGSRGFFGEPMEPDENETVEIVSATDTDGQKVELTNGEVESLEAQAWEFLRMKRRDAIEEKAEEQWEDRRLFERN